MRGLGTLINVACIIIGGIVGCLAGNRLKANVQETVMTVTGAAVMMLGIGGTMQHMLVIQDGTLNTTGTLMMIVSLALGSAVGEMLQIQQKVEQFGEWLKHKSNSNGDPYFVTGFVTASCTVCIGAMAIIGAIQDGASGDYSILLAKGIIDAIIICIMASTLGKGCIFSAIPVAAVQGVTTLLAYFIGNLLPVQSLHNLSYVGSVLIFCIGMNLMRTKQIRVANTLPSLIVAVIWGIFSL